MNRATIKILIKAILILLVAGCLALAIGSVYVPLPHVIKGLFKMENDALYQSIIFYVRLPRVIVAILVGMNLSASGVCIQAIFRNPMAGPGIIGISSGAGLGALICIALGLSTRSLYYIPVFASIFALISAYLVYRIASCGAGDHLVKLILVGIAISMLIRAVIQMIISILEDQQIAQYVFWSMGSLADRRWEHVFLILVPTIVCMAFFIYMAKNLNLLLLGEEEAESSGYDVKKGKRNLLILTSVATAIAVSVGGMITFVGLIVPHIMRLIVGADNKKLLPVSIIAGGIFLLVCDLIARTVISPSEMSVGIITSLIGAPILLYLIQKRMKGASQ